MVSGGGEQYDSNMIGKRYSVHVVLSRTCMCSSRYWNIAEAERGRTAPVG